METQLNLQGILMQESGGKRLAAGDYLISVSPEGHEFRALVNRQGIVDGWYLADLDGMPVALFNTNQGGSGGMGGPVYNCFAKYGKDISDCAYLDSMGHSNRYKDCVDNKWILLMDCLTRVNGPVIR